MLAVLLGQRSSHHVVVDHHVERPSLELIRDMASDVRHLIEEQIVKAGMYSMLIEECKDDAGHPAMKAVDLF